MNVSSEVSNKDLIQAIVDGSQLIGEVKATLELTANKDLSEAETKMLSKVVENSDSITDKVNVAANELLRRLTDAQAHCDSF